MRLFYRISMIAMIVVFILLLAGYIIVASYDYNKFKPDITGIVKELTGRDLFLMGDIHLKPGLVLTASVENGALGNAPWGSSPHMLSIKRIEARAPLLSLLRGELVFKNLTLVEPKLRIERDRSGKSNLDFDLPKQEEALSDLEEEKGLVFEFETVRILDGEFLFKSDRTGASYTVGVERLDLLRGRGDDMVEVKITGSFNEVPFRISGEMGRLYTLTTGRALFPVNLELSALDMVAFVHGKLENPFELRGIDLGFSARGKEAETVLKLIRDEPRLQGPFHLSGHFTGESPENFKASDLKVELGGMNINGSLSYAETGGKPSVEAELTSEKLDLRPFYEPDRKTAKPKENEPRAKTPGMKKPGAQRVFSDAPFDLEVYQALNASIDLRVRELLLPNVALDNLEQKLTLRDGHLKLSPFQADIGGGRLRADVDLRVKKDVTASVQVDVKKFDLGDMLKKLGITDRLDGALDLDFNLAGRGNSVAEIMAGVNGDFIGHMQDAEAPLKYLQLIGGDFSTNLINLFNPFHGKSDQAKINCIVFDFNIENGMAASDVILVDGRHVTVVADGVLNLKTEKLDFGIKPRPNEGIGIEGVGKISVSLSEISSPWRLRGTLASPSLGVSGSETILTAGKAVGFTALLGPAGLAGLLFSGSLGEKDPCSKALELTGKGSAEKKSLFGKKKQKK